MSHNPYDDRDFPRCPKCGKDQDVPFSADDPDVCHCFAKSLPPNFDFDAYYAATLPNPTRTYYHNLPYGIIPDDEEIVGKISNYDLVELDGVTKPDFSEPAYHHVVVRYKGKFFLRLHDVNWLISDPSQATTFIGPDDAEWELKDAGVI